MLRQQKLFNKIEIPPSQLTWSRNNYINWYSVKIKNKRWWFKTHAKISEPKQIFLFQTRSINLANGILWSLLKLHDDKLVFFNFLYFSWRFSGGKQFVVWYVDLSFLMIFCVFMLVWCCSLIFILMKLC